MYTFYMVSKLVLTDIEVVNKNFLKFADHKK